MQALLTVWNDCVPSAREDYERWYTEEHLPERLSLPGFDAGHRYEAVIADRLYFTFYEVCSVEVLRNQSYLSRLDDPTPWTRRIMPAFTNAVRTVCAVTARYGDIQGAHMVTLRRQAGPAGEVSSLLSGAVAAEGVTRVQIWTATKTQTPSTAEARTRPAADGLIQEALISEFLRVADALSFAAKLESNHASLGQIGVYSHLCSLHRRGGSST